MVEGREAPRYRVQEACLDRARRDKITCTVRDLSITGASLEVSDPKSVPQKFTLVIPEDGLRIACQVVRRTEFRMGIKFE